MTLYDPEVVKAIAKIRDSNAKLVCIQLPDGMKPYAKEITDKIESETKARVLIWSGSNFISRKFSQMPHSVLFCPEKSYLNFIHLPFSVCFASSSTNE